MTENEIGKIVVECALMVHRNLGPSLLESVYELALAHELRKCGLKILRQEPIPIRYDTLVFDEGLRADLIVDDLVIIELKSVEDVHPVFKKQLLTYLRLTNMRLGYLINFGAPLIKDGITRVSNGAPDWRDNTPS